MSRQATLPTRFTPRFWKDLDQRTAASRAIVERLDLLSQDVGVDSAQKRILVQRAAFLSIWLESLELNALEGAEALDSGRYAQSVNTLIGLLRVLGCERAVSDIPSLGQYISGKAAGK